MTRRVKLVTSLSTLAAVSALTLAGCGGEGEADGAEGESEQATVSGADGSGAAPHNGDGESEGAAHTGDPATDDIAYIKLLGLTRGHLAAFYELYHGDAIDMAKTHVKHPESELYQQLSLAFTARKQAGFAVELSKLAETAAAGGDIDQDYSDAIEAIDAHMPKADPEANLLAIAEIVRTAADEFDIGVEDDGAISNPHEYQDAYGFLVASRDILSSIETHDVNETDAIGLAHEQIEAALASFDGLTSETTGGRASTLYGAAARIEIAARGLD